MSFAPDQNSVGATAVAAAPRPSGRPLITLRGTTGWSALDLRELWHFRDLALTLAGRDIKVRYKQTFLGVAWVVLQPLLAAGVLSFVFGKVAKLPTDGQPYFLFSYAGLLAWNVFNTTLTKTSTSMLGNTHLISKVYFPRLILPISGVFSTLIDFGVALAMMMVMLLAYRDYPGWPILLLPIWLLLGILMSLGIGLVAGGLVVTYRDVGYILPVILQLLFYASPVAYAASAVPENWRLAYNLNPLVGLIEAFRWSLLKADPAHPASVGWLHVLYSAAVSVIMFLVGAFMFKRLERQFVDVI